MAATLGASPEADGLPLEFDRPDTAGGDLRPLDLRRRGEALSRFVHAGQVPGVVSYKTAMSPAWSVAVPVEPVRFHCTLSVCARRAEVIPGSVHVNENDVVPVTDGGAKKAGPGGATTNPATESSVTWRPNGASVTRTLTVTTIPACEVTDLVSPGTSCHAEDDVDAAVVVEAKDWQFVPASPAPAVLASTAAGATATTTAATARMTHRRIEPSFQRDEPAMADLLPRMNPRMGVNV